ncbi:glycerol-3-phosphate acyltransferase [Niallia sp. 03133]|uniref:glycerol-3-phosphate acyltransferase n=1 Tax=Niallia sp. 03133 TaxID=3458060 RepID=UPI0040445D9A
MFILYYIISYLIGNILFGYIVGKVLTGKDIRLQGSKNVGARNAGRLFGKKAFVFTFLGDALKGSVIVVIGKYADFSNAVIIIGMFFVCLGHIKPLLFRFKGGKGISTFIGGMITLDPLFIAVILISFLVFYFLYKGFTIPGFFALFTVCIVLVFIEKNILSSTAAFLTWLMIFLSHRINWRKLIQLKASN